MCRCVSSYKENCLKMLLNMFTAEFYKLNPLIAKLNITCVKKYMYFIIYIFHCSINEILILFLIGMLLFCNRNKITTFLRRQNQNLTLKNLRQTEISKKKKIGNNLNSTKRFVQLPLHGFKFKSSI